MLAREVHRTLLVAEASPEVGVLPWTALRRAADLRRTLARLSRARARVATKPSMAVWKVLETTSVTSSEENKALAAVMKAGLGKLTKERRARLQVLFDKAVKAGSAVR